MLGGYCCSSICYSRTQKPEMGSPWASWLALLSSAFNSGEPDSENKVKSSEDSWLSALGLLHRYTRPHRHTCKHNCTDTGKYIQIPTFKKKTLKKWKSKHDISFKLFYCILGCFIYPVMESLVGFTVTLTHMLYDENFPEMQCILECISPLAGIFPTAESLPCLFPPPAEFCLAKKCF